MAILWWSAPHSLTRGAGTYTGKAYVFQKPEQGWSNLTEIAQLLPTDWSPNHGSFGDYVAIWKNTIFVLDPGALYSGTVNYGAVYVYVRPNTGWTNMTQTARLTFTYDPSDYLAFSGGPIAVNDEALFVGQHEYRIPHTDPNEKQGAVYVFVKPAAGWTDFTESLLLTSPDWNTASDGWEKMRFGSSIAVTSDTLVAGAPEYYINSTFKGRIYTGVTVCL